MAGIVVAEWSFLYWLGLVRRSRDWGDTFLKFNASLSVMDYFTPFDQLKLANNDLDLGSGSGMLLPTQKGKFPNEIISAGKEGLI
jgi:hypothetical protein